LRIEVGSGWSPKSSVERCTAFPYFIDYKAEAPVLVNMNAKFDAKYFREKAALCERLADGFPLNNGTSPFPRRSSLMKVAEIAAPGPKNASKRNTQAMANTGQHATPMFFAFLLVTDQLLPNCAQ
jgi:hypothetical protein